MTGHGSKFGRKREEAIAALLTQSNVEDAARAINVAPKTLLRWMKEPLSALTTRRRFFGPIRCWTMFGTLKAVQSGFTKPPKRS